MIQRSEGQKLQEGGIALQEFCHKCGEKLSESEQFCPWCGEQIYDTSTEALNNETDKSKAISLFEKRVGKFKVSRFRDAAIGVAAIGIMIVFVAFITVNYIKSNTYQASIISYLNILNGEGGYKDLKSAVGEDLLNNAVKGYYKSDLSKIKKGINRLVSVSAASKQTSDFVVTVKNVTELDEIDLLAYKHSKADSYGNGFSINATGGYDIEVVQSFTDKNIPEETKTFTVLRIGTEWCAYDALELLDDAVNYSKLSEKEFDEELSAVKGSK